jgi:hypothetical protein
MYWYLESVEHIRLLSIQKKVLSSTSKIKRENIHGSLSIPHFFDKWHTGGYEIGKD